MRDLDRTVHSRRGQRVVSFVEENNAKSAGRLQFLVRPRTIEVGIAPGTHGHTHTHTHAHFYFHLLLFYLFFPFSCVSSRISSLAFGFSTLSRGQGLLSYPSQLQLLAPLLGTTILFRRHETDRCVNSVDALVPCCLEPTGRFQGACITGCLCGLDGFLPAAACKRISKGGGRRRRRLLEDEE